MNLNGENDLSQNFSNFWGSHGTRKRERKYVGKIQREFLMRTFRKIPGFPNSKIWLPTFP